jgi:hypothetical protein
MIVVTYGLTGAPATDRRARPDRPTRLFARFMKALRDSRLRQARRVIERHAHLPLPDYFPKIEREGRSARLIR